ncbi:hypothetical protein SAMN05428957_102323 [Oryzisolibacter propanilivorax]|uniref:Dodecin domain-containing protein n=1 Tax=Oryzisolibacter propanilivorax TaxID=1527607 RepID=A0A1G9QHH2_9BURK|nr:dodecin family protein [Oryzisolibacter propanilivorax]SDM10426.1 hypothetical protein SAMN05428957_102323 [Oryzisolibacter propanilivorax]
MSIAKVVEISSTSNKSFEEAIENGIRNACKDASSVRGAWIKEQKVTVEGGRIAAYRVNMQVTFVENAA